MHSSQADFGLSCSKLFGSELKFSTTNHPQTDGQTEMINALLEEYLRHYVTTTQKNWVDLLDTAQLCYNLQRSSATGMSPFELTIGVQPRMPLEVAKQKVGRSSPAAYKMTQSHKTRQRGLIPKYDGPFELSEPYQEDLDAERVQTKRTPPLVMKQFDREIEKILDHRTMGHSRKNQRTNFLVQWKGTLKVEATWERDVTLWQVETTVQAYWQTKSTGASTSAGGGLSEEVEGKPDVHHGRARCAPHQTTVDSHHDAYAQHKDAMPCAPRGINHGRNAMTRCYGVGPDGGIKQHSAGWCTLLGLEGLDQRHADGHSVTRGTLRGRRQLVRGTLQQLGEKDSRRWQLTSVAVSSDNKALSGWWVVMLGGSGPVA
ncbi:hypothetical protein CK203_054218 [Vitis vinifera]|uniref:Uncharacterized protein n=1 Tax=Vitis vinifera TaxID=29760 RepID=A0A438HGE0_VITVI|nr:hypothetical protein CK203_054218 [Vitis vinifera]